MESCPSSAHFRAWAPKTNSKVHKLMNMHTGLHAYIFSDIQMSVVIFLHISMGIQKSMCSSPLVQFRRWCPVFQKAKDIPDLADGF